MLADQRVAVSRGVVVEVLDSIPEISEFKREAMEYVQSVGLSFGKVKVVFSEISFRRTQELKFKFQRGGLVID